MSYTIAQVSEITHLSPYTLRYYDKKGLLPFVARSPQGIRLFEERDIERIRLICCLKETGMKLQEIATFIGWCMEGDSTLEKRLQMFLEHKAAVQRQLEEIKRHLITIDHKIQYYQTAVEAGTEAVHPSPRHEER